MDRLMLELYSGTGRMANAFRKLGWRGLTVDLYEAAELEVDVFALTREQIIAELGGSPSVIWASPPCTSFSVASIGKHWKIGDDGVPYPFSDGAKLGIALLRRTLEIASWFPDAKLYIENPRGMMRTMPEIKHLRRETITFCQYGENRMKPTDIWTTDLSWKPRPPCKKRMPCHEAAPRGSRTGTQGMKNAYDRGALPFDFCDELASHAEASK